MTQGSPSHTMPASSPQKAPRGILKNSLSTSAQSPPIGSDPSPSSPTGPSVDPTQPHEMSERELTLQNTIANAGPRRNSSNTRSSFSLSRRQSSTHTDPSSYSSMDLDENDGPRLKWDEANLWRQEQERVPHMKIDEPKTPFVGRYDPADDDDEISAIDARDLMVDELDQKVNGHPETKHRGSRDEPIPDLDLGEPEDPVVERHHSDGEKRVVMENGTGEAGDDESDPHNMSEEGRRKHQEFERRRKRHYDMHNVKDMLAHPEDLDELAGSDD